jgi:hypothetical protein
MLAVTGGFLIRSRFLSQERKLAERSLGETSSDETHVIRYVIP